MDYVRSIDWLSIIQITRNATKHDDFYGVPGSFVNTTQHSSAIYQVWLTTICGPCLPISGRKQCCLSCISLMRCFVWLFSFRRNDTRSLQSP